MRAAFPFVEGVVNLQNESTSTENFSAKNQIEGMVIAISSDFETQVSERYQTMSNKI